MKLDVLPDSDPWYAGGLKFTCTQCGNCCTGPSGYVWITEEEVERLAAHLNLTPREVLSRYCRKEGRRWTLKERRTPQGNYDCIFLADAEVDRPKRRELAAGEALPLRKRGCSIYSVRPLQCRTWPFWQSNLASPEAWESASQKCPGLDRGGRSFTKVEIETLRDAEDWPENPPGSQPRSE